MNPGFNFDQRREGYFGDQGGTETLAKREAWEPSVPVKTLDLVNLRPQQIVDIKRSELNPLNSRKLKDKSSSLTSPTHTFKFMVQFVGMGRMDPGKNMQWVKDLNSLGPKKLQLQLLLNFKKNMKSFDQNAIQSYRDTRLNLLSAYLKSQNIVLEDDDEVKHRVPPLGLSNKAETNIGVDQFDYSRENTNVLGSILNNVSSVGGIYGKGQEERYLSKPSEFKTYDFKQNVKMENFSKEVEKDIDDSVSNAEEDNQDDKSISKQESEAENDFKRQRSSKRQPKPTRRNQLVNRPVRRKTVKKDSRTESMEPRRHYASTIKEEAKDMWQTDNLKESEDRIDYILNIQLVEKILQIKKRYINTDKIETKMAFNELEKLRESIKSTLVEVERRSENLKS